MGAILEQTDAMGEYHGEVRKESFYLKGEDTHAYVYDRAPEPPAHIIHVYPEGVLSDISDPMADLDLELRLERLDREMQTCGPGGRLVWAEVKRELLRARAAGQEKSHHGFGMVEILIEDIPKIRAVFDAVEAHGAKKR